MSFTDRRPPRADEKQHVDTQSLKIPGLVTELSPVEQLSFPDQPLLAESAAPSSADEVPQLDFPASPNTGPFISADLLPSSEGPQTSEVPVTSPHMTQSLIIPPAVTRHLANTGALMPVGKDKTMTTTRQPVVIRGSGTKSTGMLPPPRPKGKRSRVITHLTVASLLVFVVLGALLVVAPAGHGQNGLGLFQSGSNAVTSKGNNSSSIAQQAATATAVMQDGHDVGTNSGQYTFVPAAPTGANNGSLGRFFYGQCTYWANMRYHQLTGNWVTWLGDAWAWQGGAMSAGWNVSSVPHVPSIIVLQPGVEGAGGYGHVAVVESIDGNGTITASTWNWWPNLGANTSSVKYTYPSSGVSFIWR